MLQDLQLFTLLFGSNFSVQLINLRWRGDSICLTHFLLPLCINNIGNQVLVGKSRVFSGSVEFHQLRNFSSNISLTYDYPDGICVFYELSYIVN